MSVSGKITQKYGPFEDSCWLYGVITLAVPGTGTRTKTETRTMGDNRCWPLSLFRCSVKGST